MLIDLKPLCIHKVTQFDKGNGIVFNFLYLTSLEFLARGLIIYYNIMIEITACKELQVRMWLLSS